MIEGDATWIDRLLGVAGGTTLGMVFLLPRSWGGFGRRVVASIVGGWFFGEPVNGMLIAYTTWGDGVSYVIASYCLTAMLSWWGIGALVRALEKRFTKA